MLRTLYKTPCEPAARYELAVLAMQRGDQAAADMQLRRLGMRYRVNTTLWSNTRVGPTAKDTDSVHVFEPALPATVFSALSTALQEPAFWDAHGYPTDCFFSYNVPLTQKTNGLMSQAIRLMQKSLEKATGSKFAAAEWWAHKRGIGADGGHQLHFDLDERARDLEHVVRHPTYSSVLYLDIGAGTAPTVITDQRVDQSNDDVDTEDAACWRCHPAANRLLTFDGGALHGVVPVIPEQQQQVSDRCRITLMIGWWTASPSVSSPPEMEDEGALVGLGPNMPLPELDQQKLSPWEKLLIASGSECKIDKEEPSMIPCDEALESCGKLWHEVASLPAGEKPKKLTPGAEDVFTGHFFVQDPCEVFLACMPGQQGEQDEAGEPEEFIEVEEMSLEDLKRLRGE